MTRQTEIIDFPIPVRVIAFDEVVKSGKLTRCIAHIFAHPEGKSLGESKAGRQVCPSGMVSSIKTGVGMPWLTHKMRVLIHLLECLPDVIDYRTYPHRLEIVADGKKKSFVPDVIIDEVGRGVTVASFGIKDRKLFAKATRVYEALGWHLELFDAGQFRINSNLAFALQRFLEYRHVHFTNEDTFTVREMLEVAGGRLQIHTLSVALGGAELSLAKLISMSFHSIVRFENILDIRPTSWISKPAPRRVANISRIMPWGKPGDLWVG